MFFSFFYHLNEVGNPWLVYLVTWWLPYTDICQPMARCSRTFFSRSKRSKTMEKSLLMATWVVDRLLSLPKCGINFEINFDYLDTVGMPQKWWRYHTKAETSSFRMTILFYPAIPFHFVLYYQNWLTQLTVDLKRLIVRYFT